MNVETVEFKITSVRFTGSGDFRIVAGTDTTTRDKVSAKGNIGEVHKGDIVTAQGVWKSHPKFGPQLEVVSASVLPNDEAGFVGWAKARLPGLGDKRAQEIWDAYGARVWSMLKKGDTSMLTALQGITAAKAAEILKAYEKHAAEAEQVQPLMDFGFGLASAKAIVDTFGVTSASTLEEDPYRFLAARGVTFDEIDKLTRRAGMDRNAWQRVHGMAVDILTKHASATGDTRGTGKLLQPAFFAAERNRPDFLDAMERGGLVVPAGKGFMGLKRLVEAEKSIARALGLSGDLGQFGDLQF